MYGTVLHVCMYVVSVCMHAWMSGLMDGCMAGWLDGQMDGWMDGMNEFSTHACMYVCNFCMYVVYLMYLMYRI